MVATAHNIPSQWLWKPSLAHSESEETTNEAPLGAFGVGFAFCLATPPLPAAFFAALGARSLAAISEVFLRAIACREIASEAAVMSLLPVFRVRGEP